MVLSLKKWGPRCAPFADAGVCSLVLFILLTSGTTSDVKHRTIVTQTHFRRYRQYHVRLLIYVFSGKYAVVKPTPVLPFHTTQRACWEISVKCLSQGPNDVMPNTGIEPATLRSLARRSNQLHWYCGRGSYASKSNKKYIYLSSFKVTFFFTFT